MDEHDLTTRRDTVPAEQTTCVKRRYQSPVLTEYGSVEELVDSGVVGSMLSSV